MYGPPGRVWRDIIPYRMYVVWDEECGTPAVHVPCTLEKSISAVRREGFLFGFRCCRTFHDNGVNSSNEDGDDIMRVVM